MIQRADVKPLQVYNNNSNINKMHFKRQTPGKNLPKGASTKSLLTY